MSPLSRKLSSHFTSSDRSDSMDEHTFQDELRQLKQRVSEMSLSSQQRQREHLVLEQSRDPQMFLWPYAPDSFSSQLCSIKHQLNSMQRTVAAQVQQQQQASSPWTGPQANIALPPHGGLDAPSTPLYWQLYSALKTDVQAVDERVASIEALCSELEDRVDALEPRRFTPPGSEDGGEVSTSHAPAKLQTQSGTDAAVVQPSETTASTEAVLAGDGGAPTGTLDEAFANMRAQLERHNRVVITGVGSTPQSDAPAQSTTASSLPPLPPSGVAFRDKEIDRLEELLKRSHDINKINDATLEFREQEVSQLEARARNADESAHQMIDTCSAQASELDRRNDTIRHLSTELHDFKASRHHFMTKYVDENYRYKWLKQKKNQSEDQLQRRIDELEQALADVEDGKIAAQNDELEKVQSFCAEKDAVVFRQEEIIARGGKMIQQRDADIVHLEGRLEEADRERIYLREESDGLVSELKQRDATIQQLQREIEYRAARQQELENDRQKDTERLKRASQLMRAAAQRDESGPPTQAEPFDQAARAASNGQNPPSSVGWTPRPIPGYVKLPHEENRALLWGQGQAAPTPARHNFGSASPMTGTLAARQQQRRGSYRAVRRGGGANNFEQPSRSREVMDECTHADALHSANNSDQRSREQMDGYTQFDASHGVDAGSGNDSNSNFRRHADWAGEKQRSRMAAQSRPSRPSRHSLPLDATFWPPLPAPVPAEGRRVESVPNLRASQSSAIAKPASMEQLGRPRPRLQAYVEEDLDEGGDGERGDGSLLD